MQKFTVVVRGFYREDEPRIRIVSARSEQEASDCVMADYNVKQILDIKQGVVEFLEAEINEYWLMYNDQKSIDYWKVQ